MSFGHLAFGSEIIHGIFYNKSPLEINFSLIQKFSPEISIFSESIIWLMWHKGVVTPFYD